MSWDWQQQRRRAERWNVEKPFEAITKEKSQSTFERGRREWFQGTTSYCS
jgi:hypothetical protein